MNYLSSPKKKDVKDRKARKLARRKNYVTNSQMKSK